MDITNIAHLHAPNIRPPSAIRFRIPPALRLAVLERAVARHARLGSARCRRRAAGWPEAADRAALRPRRLAAGHRNIHENCRRRGAAGESPLPVRPAARCAQPYPLQEARQTKVQQSEGAVDRHQPARLPERSACSRADSRAAAAPSNRSAVSRHHHRAASASQFSV